MHATLKLLSQALPQDQMKNILLIIMAVSIACQFLAAFMAIRLIPLSGAFIAWTFLACGFTVQAIRRFVSLTHVLTGQLQVDMAVEVMGLIISVLMLCGIWKFRPLFSEIKRAHQVMAAKQDELQEINHRLEEEAAERKHLEQQLLAFNAELELRVSRRTAELARLNKELESFCYSISHELRAPIARLEAFSKVLTECVDDARPDELSHLAERITVASLRLRTVIDALLQMNRIARADLDREEIDLTKMSRQILNQLLEEGGDRKVAVSIAPDLVAQADRSMLFSCLQHLLGNALKYSAKVPEALIEIGQFSREGTTVYYVRDNGAGFEMEFSDKLFEPFCRLHNESEFEGSGIGLATVQRIIERHGGRIWAESVPGKGATFYFTLGGCQTDFWAGDA